MTRLLPEGAHIGGVRLRVADLKPAVRFYEQVVGMRSVAAEVSQVELSATGARPALLTLFEDSRAPRRPPSTTGLFHFALLVPGRRDLARALLHIRDEGWRLQGFADHTVSEALYLSDPEGNGIEIYADRPRSSWTWDGADLRMTTDPLDVPDLLAAAGTAEPWNGLAPGTVMGHVHLEVADLATAEDFYVRRIGFDVTVRGYPGARFLAAGGYHHHLAVNVWNRARGHPPAGALGLVDFEIVVPGKGARETLEDPFGIGIVLRDDE
jgi:catechol 2,3-dioxygenase